MARSPPLIRPLPTPNVARHNPNMAIDCPRMAGHPPLLPGARLRARRLCGQRLYQCDAHARVARLDRRGDHGTAA
eukprot:1163955-Prymnesium_polylepis.1